MSERGRLRFSAVITVSSQEGLENPVQPLDLIILGLYPSLLASRLEAMNALREM